MAPDILIDETGGSDSDSESEIVQEAVEDIKLTGPMPKIVYKRQYKDRHGIVMKTHTSASPFDSNTDRSPPSQRPVLEICTSIVSSREALKDEIDEPTIEGTVMKIFSEKLINAIRAVVEYYPHQGIMGNVLTVPEPYAFLVHHMEELEAYKTHQTSVHSEEYARECNEQIDLLLTFLRGYFEDALESERERHSREPPMCTYEYLWLLFKPGTDLLTKLYGSMRQTVTEEMDIVMGNGRPTLYHLHDWGMDYDGETYARVGFMEDVKPFDGEHEIRSLPTFPKRFHQEDLVKQGGLPLQEMLVKRGEMYFRIVRGSCMDYRGETLSTPTRRYESRIVVDHQAFYARGIETPPKFGQTDGDHANSVKGCRCEVCRERKDSNHNSKFKGYDDINAETTKELMPHQYALLPQSIYAFVLKVRSWQHLNIEHVREARYDPTVINKLVMPDETKNMIKALSRRLTEQKNSDGSTSHWSGDFIEGKGEGQIFLFHGSPGVGKTFTAECIAEYTQRPLLSITAADIGLNPNSVEEQLLKYFKMAKLWGAILLLDEADVYLEKRVSQDLHRNILVSVFLRAMEYYQGILILTTNRVGAFDDAITSRVHIILHYKDLSDADREKIWTNNFNRLEDEQGQAIRVPYATLEFVKENKALKEIKWNGREIRNAFQTAVALAQYQAAENNLAEVKLHPRHFEAVVSMSKSFKEYMTSTHRGFDEARRAKRDNIRDDSFGTPKQPTD